MKRFISVITILLMLFSLGLTSVAETETETEEMTQSDKYATDKINFLASLGVFEFEYDIYDAVTRSEYAQILTRLLNMENMLSEEEVSIYSDVPADDYAAPAINYMNQMGIMKGKSADCFFPEDELTLNEAVAGIVRLMGYDQKAMAKGGYTGGYMLTATDLGALAGITSDMYDEYMSAGGIAIMICNILDKPMVNSYEFADSGVKVSGNSTVTIAETYLHLTKEKGLVNSFDTLNLYGVRDNTLDMELIEINGETYYFEYLPLSEYVGYNVTYYVKEDEAAVYPTVMYASKEVSSKEITVYSDDISSVSPGSLEYKEGDNDKTKTLKISSNAIVLTNGYPVSELKNEYSPKNGFIRLISNDGIKYDVVMIFDYSSFVVKSVLEGKVTFKYEATFNGSGSIDISGDEIMASVRKDGEILDYTAVQKGQIISVAYHAGSGYFVEISEKQIEGNVISISQNPHYTVNVDETEYRVNDEFLKKIEAGVEGTSAITPGKKHKFSIDFLGKIAGMDETIDTFYYGYVKGIKKESELSDEISARIYSNDTKKWNDYVFAEKCKLNGENSTHDKIYEAVKKFIAAMEAKNVIKADGSYDDNGFFPPVLKFKVSTEGEINSIVTDFVVGNHPEEIGEKKIVISSPLKGGVYQNSYGYFTTFRSDVGDIFAKNRPSFLIPQSGDEKGFDYGIVHKIFPAINNEMTPRIVYDLDEYGVPGMVARIVETAGSSVRADQNYCVVDHISQGDNCYIIYGYNSTGASVKYSTTDDDDVMEMCAKLEKGDFIQTNEDANGLVAAIAFIFSYDSSKYNEKLYKSGGEVYKRVQELSNNSGFGLSRFEKLKDTSEGTILCFDSNMPELLYKKANAQSVLFYDGDRFVKGNIYDLTDGDLIFFRIYSATIYGITCIKNSSYTNEEMLAEKQ